MIEVLCQRIFGLWNHSSKKSNLCFPISRAALRVQMTRWCFQGSFSAYSEAIAGRMCRTNTARPRCFIIATKRWSSAGVFEKIFKVLVTKNADFRTLMIDASHIKTHRITLNGLKKPQKRAGHRQNKRRVEQQAALGL